MIDYDHSRNLHVASAPRIIVPLILARYSVNSVLDVGCGTGVWLREFIKNGIVDAHGIDGVPIANRYFEADEHRFRCFDLSKDWDLCRRYSLALCLEVAEHLPRESASSLIKNITRHADTIVFSAACPNQVGQGHINCDWPEYWQGIFNSYGFSCNDWLRARIWQEDFSEYWYKQNIFVATKDSSHAGSEQRLLPLVHPQMLQSCINAYEKNLVTRLGRQLSSSIETLRYKIRYF